MTKEITVVKCGGGLSAYRETICQDLAAVAAGGPVVLVHGGAAQIAELAAQLGVPQRRLRTPNGSSSRYTDPATLDVLLMTMAGRVKPALVAALSRYGARPVGLTGMDAGLVTARRAAAHKAVVDGRTRVVRDDHSGRIRDVDLGPLNLLLDAGLLPVLSPPALDTRGEPVNVDADRMAAAIAGALAEQWTVRLVLLTSAPGVLRDPEDPGSLLPHVNVSQDSLGQADARGGMTAKLQAARAALDTGVAHVVVADGRTAQPVSEALAGAGTRIEQAATLGSGNV